jgi:phosphoribosyl-ATP pyrophosphohydrolase
MQDGQGRAELVGEVADLWFHCMVMLSHLDVEIGEVTDCLRARFGTSGIEEKARRSTG